MLLSDEEIEERIGSPLNLMNRLKAATRSAGEKQQSLSPCLPPTTKDLNLDIDEKIAVGKLRETAAGIMALSLEQLKTRIPEIQKPEKLAQIATEMNKVVQSRPDDGKANRAQIIVYAPQVINENHFEEIVLPNDQG